MAVIETSEVQYGTRMVFPCPEDACQGEGGGYGAARAGWRPLPHQLRLRLCKQLAEHFLLNLPHSR